MTAHSINSSKKTFEILKDCIPYVFFLYTFLFLITACSSHYYSQEQEPVLTSINIVDRNGLTETITTQERLDNYEKTDFLKPQPYQQVLRIYSRDDNGDVSAYITSYHANGEPKQYLEIKNARAYGKYFEWHPNGELKLEANIVGGVAEINDVAEGSWVFDGVNQVWDENGNLEATFCYEKGELQGLATYYHPNGQIWKTITYDKNDKHGPVQLYLDNGELLQTIDYVSGQKNGISLRYWRPNQIASEENFEQGLLKNATYFDIDGKMIAKITEGEGYRSVFGKEKISELHEYHGGFQEGEIKLFDALGSLVQVFHTKGDLKHGEEIYYYSDTTNLNQLNPNPVRKLSLAWSEGKIQGLVKTWYPTGQLESQREMSNNVKNGLLSTWYKDGNLMMIEEYEHDKLVNGDYFKRGDKIPLSQIKNGKGTATLYDPEGNFIRKTVYLHGKTLS